MKDTQQTIENTAEEPKTASADGRETVAENVSATTRSATGARAPRRKSSKGGRPSRDRKPREFEQKMISIRRVTRVVSGGRRFAFSVGLVIGDGKGGVGVGMGKAGDTTLAIEKALTDAKKNFVKISLTDIHSIPHEVEAKYKSARVFIMPNYGRGVVAGSSVRSIFELAGIHSVTAKISSRTKNKVNIARATIEALRIFTTRAGAVATPISLEKKELPVTPAQEA